MKSKFDKLRKRSFKQIERMKPVTLDEQIATVESNYRCHVDSFTHCIGRHKGSIPEGPLRDEANALRCALKTLKSLKSKK